MTRLLSHWLAVACFAAAGCDPDPTEPRGVMTAPESAVPPGGKGNRFCKTDLSSLEARLAEKDRYLIANPEEVKYLIKRRGTRGPIDPKHTSGDMPVYWLAKGDVPDSWLMCVYHRDQGQALLIPDGHSFVPPAAHELGRRRWLPLEGPWPDEEPEEK
jgi:hypothetical protein